jgi:hypothetical protein
VYARQPPAMACDSHLGDQVQLGSINLMLGLRQRLAEDSALGFKPLLCSFRLSQLPRLQCKNWVC